MARPRTVEPKDVIAKFRDGTFKYGSEAARHFGCSRVRINQILNEHAPDLIVGKVKPQTAAETKVVAKRQKAMIVATEKALNKHPTHTAAAEALGLTKSGLYSRMRRFGIEFDRQSA